MNDPREPGRSSLPSLGLLANQLYQLRRSMPPRDRLLLGGFYALCAATSASLAYFVAQAVGLQQGFWAAMTAISVSQNSYAEVRNSSRDQFLGAIIGALTGLAAATLGHEHFLAYVAAVMAGLTLSQVLNLGAAGRISGVTSTIILLAPHEGPFWGFALLRLGEVLLGATAALGVTLLAGRLVAPLERRWRKRKDA